MTPWLEGIDEGSNEMLATCGEVELGGVADCVSKTFVVGRAGEESVADGTLVLCNT